jgi:hypothetical protein
MNSTAQSPTEAPITEVILDMDGVLVDVDSEPLVFEAERIPLAELGADLTEQVKKPFMGMGGHEVLQACWTASAWRQTSPPCADTRARSTSSWPARCLGSSWAPYCQPPGPAGRCPGKGGNDPRSSPACGRQYNGWGSRPALRLSWVLGRVSGERGWACWDVAAQCHRGRRCRPGSGMRMPSEVGGPQLAIWARAG